MHIAHIAPLTEAIPPKLYGGTERVVHWLVEELVALGHEVTLFASGDSRTSANLDAPWPRALRLDGSIRDPNALHMLMLERVRQRADEFDFLHFHLDYYPFSLMSRQRIPFITTLHGRLDLPEHQPVFETFSSIPLVSISNSQRRPLHKATWVDTVYHGLPRGLLAPKSKTPSYLAFLGRISPEKRVGEPFRRQPWHGHRVGPSQEAPHAVAVVDHRDRWDGRVAAIHERPVQRRARSVDAPHERDRDRGGSRRRGTAVLLGDRRERGGRRQLRRYGSLGRGIVIAGREEQAQPREQREESSGGARWHRHLTGHPSPGPPTRTRRRPCPARSSRAAQPLSRRRHRRESPRWHRRRRGCHHGREGASERMRSA